MSKNATYRPRSYLPANQETQPGYRKKIQADAKPFGIYGALTPDSVAKIREGLISAKKIAEKFLQSERKGPSADVAIPEGFGVTFLQKNKVNIAIQKGLFHHNFQLQQVRTSINEYNLDFEELAVPIACLDWYPERGRKLVAVFADGESTEALKKTATDVGGLLINAKGEQLKAVPPNHTSLMQYGDYGDKLDLSKAHKAELASAIYEDFMSKDIGSVIVGKLVVGPSYMPAAMSPAAMSA